MLTGETMPASVAPGSAVSAGMLNISGPILVRADALGDDTLLKQIARLVETAERSRGRYASLADRASQFYSHIVNVLAITAFFGWGLATQDWRLAINIGAAVSREGTEIGTTPRVGHRPVLGRNPTTPHSAAGMRMEPPVSVPRPMGAKRTAMAAAVPPLEPPAMRAGA